MTLVSKGPFTYYVITEGEGRRGFTNDYDRGGEAR